MPSHLNSSSWGGRYFRRQFDELAGHVAAWLLRRSCKVPTQQWDPDTIIINALTDAVLKDPLIPLQETSKDRTTAKNYLDMLSREHSGMFSRQGISLKINYQVIYRLVRSTFIDGTILQKFGLHAYRVYRLVVQKKYIGQKQCFELGLLGEFKLTKALLNKLYINGVLKSQEVPKGSERFPSKCNYLWSCDLPAVALMLQTRCCEAMAELQLRLVDGQHVLDEAVRKRDILV